MECKRQEYSVKYLVNLWEQEMLSIDPEYQRGPVWEVWQKKQFIDSMMRDYPVPVLYFHHIHREVGNFYKDILRIIDGQQRIRALYDFYKNEWQLFNPTDDNSVASFPNFVKNKGCAWGGKSFEQCDDELKESFLSKKLQVVEIESSDENEVRDLFIRLQAGSPLNDQEVRDAWPGKFTEFILKLGGKPEIAGCPGHQFFRDVMKMKPGGDRGATRKLAAGIAMLYLEFLDKKSCAFKSRDLNDYYHKNIDFNTEDCQPKRLIEILDLLNRLFADSNRPKIKGYEAIHLVLLVSSLMDGYPKGWHKKLPESFDVFRERCLLATKAEKDEMDYEYSHYSNRYVRLTRSGSNNAESIELRHQFFLEEMVGLLDIANNKKDSQRSFSSIDRELVYYRDRKKCQVCIMNETGDSQVRWEESDIHHVIPHSKGGITNMDNAVLVHRHCHPKGDAQEKKFMEWWQANSRGKVLLTEEAEKHASENGQGSSSSNIDIQNPEDVKFSKITKATVAGKHLSETNWNKLVLYMIQLAFEKGLNFEKLRENLDSGPLGFQFFGIRKGDTNKVSWYYLEKEDVSIFNKEANNCLKVIKEFARILKVDFEIIFRYNNGKNAGKTGRWSS